MTRYRPSPLERWLKACGVAAGYIVLATALSWMDPSDAGVVPSWALLAVPPFYGTLSLLMLRRASLIRRLSWVGGACLTHVTLGLAAAAVVSIVTDVAAVSALVHAFARLGPVPALTLVATPLVLAPFRGRVLSVRTARRPERATRQPNLLTSSPVATETPVARDVRPREGSPEPKPAAPVPSPARRLAPPTPAPAVDAPTDGAVLRVPFERVAAQLPKGAFTLPLERVSESLREPHWLTVPQRLVLAQLPDGAVRVDWGVVASQFPSLAFAMSDVEFRHKYPDLKLTLPLDDVLRQLPKGTLPSEAMPQSIAGLEAFPAPFQPLAVPRDVPAPNPSSQSGSSAPDITPSKVTPAPPVAPSTAM